jgi:dipeptidyl aminopeptidase/acylaminoacyl peptidase
MDATIRLWDMATGEQAAVLRGHEDWILALAFDASGTRLISGSRDHTVRVWTTSSTKPLATLSGHAAPVGRLAISPDGKRIVSASADGTLKLWDAPSGSEVATLSGHEGSQRSEYGSIVGRITGLAFSPDGKQIASASTDHTLRLWGGTSGEPMATLRGHEAPVTAMSFSPDGTRIASGSSRDDTIRIWDLASGEEVATLRAAAQDDALDTRIVALAFSPDGTRLIWGSNDLNVWDSVSAAERARERRQAHQRYEEMRPFMNRLFEEEPDPRLVARRVLTDGSLDDRSRRTALNLALQRSTADRERMVLLVDELLAEQVLVAGVIDALHARPDLTKPLRALAEHLATTRGDDPSRLNRHSWQLVKKPGLSREEYLPAILGAEAACRAKPDNGAYLNTLGVARYRAGLYREALETLLRSEQLNAAAIGAAGPADVAFIAMAHHQLGHSAEASAQLLRLRSIIKDAGTGEAQAFLSEAVALIERSKDAENQNIE